MEGNDSFCALFLARIVVGHPFRNSASHVLWYSFCSRPGGGGLLRGGSNRLSTRAERP